MPEVQVRKRYTVVEEIFHEGGPVTSTPLRRAAVLAVIRNPFAGAYVKEISGFMDDLKPLGLEMARSLVGALGGDPKVVEGYGKGAIIGSAADANAQAQAQQTQQQVNQSAAAGRARADSYRRAIGACLQGRGYTVT